MTCMDDSRKTTKERLRLEHGFGPFYRPDSRLLILGSFPSVKSREISFYYGHPQNRFWRVLSAVFQDSTPEGLDEKQSFLVRHGIALYDVIESCTIIGSSDGTIRDAAAADLRPILAGSKVGDRIFVNGAKAYDLYQKQQYPQLGIPAVKLPSTSPANAAFSLERLCEAWSVLRQEAVRNP